MNSNITKPDTLCDWIAIHQLFIIMLHIYMYLPNMKKYKDLDFIFLCAALNKKHFSFELIVN